MITDNVLAQHQVEFSLNAEKKLLSYFSFVLIRSREEKFYLSMKLNLEFQRDKREEIKREFIYRKCFIGCAS